jgi:hypothetical protein
MQIGRECAVVQWCKGSGECRDRSGADSGTGDVVDKSGRWVAASGCLATRIEWL